MGSASVARVSAARPGGKARAGSWARAQRPGRCFPLVRNAATRPPARRSAPGVRTGARRYRAAARALPALRRARAIHGALGAMPPSSRSLGHVMAACLDPGRNGRGGRKGGQDPRGMAAAEEPAWTCLRRVLAASPASRARRRHQAKRSVAGPRLSPRTRSSSPGRPGRGSSPRRSRCRWRTGSPCSPRPARTRRCCGCRGRAPCRRFP